ncbi:ATP-binding protein [Alisedimentitalea sp. MJ-SS2]|uniref:ATP-binding protein n=1 Tax=Aliisedimentitalea sp. MJ-SS2 TaxID=3049795 RepID=UPI0029062802|nr:ATP-binding protein [Alisedimentitalea sp. MJ-SS2]MDU8929254.1 ATP-binding protein [Alisedimentitalea sp. MJ-SS2]
MQPIPKQLRLKSGVPSGTAPDSAPGSKLIRLGFASGEHEVRAALGQLKQILAQVDLTRDDLGTVELVLGEVLNNVVEHAYGPDQPGEIRINCRLRTDGLSFCVCDAGRAFKGSSLPPGKLPNLECGREYLPEGGFGWFLVHSLATRLRYARRGERNFFRFDIPFDQEVVRAASGQGAVG